MDVRHLMRRSAGFYRALPAVVLGDRRLSFEQAWERGVRMANRLLALGLQPGDRLAVLDDNSIEVVDAMLGAAIANLVRVPLYARNSAESHTFMLNGTQARAVIVGAKYTSLAGSLGPGAPSVEHVICCDDSYEPALLCHNDLEPDVHVDPDDLHVIRYTGGTSGAPRGVAYTHRQWLVAARDILYVLPTPDVGDSFLHVGPMSHGSGYYFMPMWLHGAANHLVQRFDPALVLSVMESEHINYTLLLPTMLQALINHPDARRRDLSSFKAVTIGSAPIADSTVLLAREIFGDVLHQNYGGTELPLAVSMNSREWFSAVEGSTPLRSAGRPLPWADVRILREDGSLAEPGEPGSVALHSDAQMAGYWQDPRATAERVIDGYVLTGDIGTLDRNGFLYILDRKDDMITSGGFHLWPAELENVIAGHGAVSEVAVVAMPHPYWGEAALAICVLRDGYTATEQEIIDLCRERLGSYKKPQRVEFRREPLPRTAVGKISRKELREPFWAGHARRISGA